MFSVGDVCVLVSYDNPKARHLVGMECTILGYETAGEFSGCYKTDLPRPQGGFWFASEKHLRKKPPYDGNTKITWDDMPYWKPKELVRV